MRIGIVPILSSFGGGVYQYSLTLLDVLHDWQRNEGQDEFVVFTKRRGYAAAASSNERGWAVRPREAPSLKRAAKEVLWRFLGEGRVYETWERSRQWFPSVIKTPDPDVTRRRPEMEGWFRRFGIELMLYPAPNVLSFETGIPYVMAIHDLQHRLQPEFPEVSAHGEGEAREYLFRNGARHATLLLADSEVGKEDILNLYGTYGVTPDRVKVLPFLPARYLTTNLPEAERQRVRSVYHLPERYLFYPAQFWPHKNHAHIIQALGLLRQRHGAKLPIVFCGAYTGTGLRKTFKEVMRLSRQLGLEAEVRHLGYVPDKDMAGLYAEATALVMPTFFGPTNIPVLEAWAFGCPVLTSDIRGIQEQVGDAAILVDPRSEEALADGIYRLWTNQSLRQTLAERGQRRLASYTPEDYRRRLIEILEEAKARVSSERLERRAESSAGR